MTDLQKRIIHIAFQVFVLSGTFSHGQNLVINSSAEQYLNCPESYTSFYKKEIIPGWASPNEGTPDYFNLCSTGDASIPENWAGYCEPIEGNAYLGVYLFRAPNYREFIQGSLVSALVISKNYEMSFYISRSIYEAFHIDQLGVLLIEEDLDLKNESLHEAFDPSASTHHKKGKLDYIDNHLAIPDLMNIDTTLGQLIPFDLLQVKLEKDWYRVHLEFEAAVAAKKFVVGCFAPLGQLAFRESDYSDLAKGTMLESSSYVMLDSFELRSSKREEDKQEEALPEPIIINEVNFEFNSAALASEGVHLLDSIFTILSSSAWHLKIVGHTDDSSDDIYNLKLSRLRAQNVANYLIEQGLKKSKVCVEAKGEEVPLMPNTSEENRRANRRVEIVFMPQEN